jgi:hypothetical protein
MEEQLQGAEFLWRVVYSSQSLFQSHHAYRSIGNASEVKSGVLLIENEGKAGLHAYVVSKA